MFRATTTMKICALLVGRVLCTTSGDDTGLLQLHHKRKAGCGSGGRLPCDLPPAPPPTRLSRPPTRPPTEPPIEALVVPGPPTTPEMEALVVETPKAGPTDMCPPPNASATFQTCLTWGDPHIEVWFDPSQLKSVRKKYNNYDLGLQRLFRTKDKQMEGQAFMCDARRKTSSAAAYAIRIGSKIVTLMRPARTGNNAWGPSVGTGKWEEAFNDGTYGFGLEMNINGEDVAYTELGDEPGHSSLQKDYTKETFPVGSYTKDNWFAQQLLWPAPTGEKFSKTNVFKPLCVGDKDRSVLLKVGVPQVDRVYEPILTIELSQDVVEQLEPDGLCMGPVAGGHESHGLFDVSYADSLFTVAQLYQLCTICNMHSGATGWDRKRAVKNSGGKVEDGGNKGDYKGWLGSEDYKGCVHPLPADKSLTGQEICETADSVAEAVEACETAGINKVIYPGWFDSCLAEYCNTDGAGGVHTEDAVNTIENVMGLVADEVKIMQAGP